MCDKKDGINHVVNQLTGCMSSVSYVRSNPSASNPRIFRPSFLDFQ